MAWSSTDRNRHSREEQQEEEKTRATFEQVERHYKRRARGPPLLDSTRLLLLRRAHGGNGIGVLARLEAERVVVDRVEAEEEEEQEDGAGEDVEDAVPDHLGRGADGVAALGARPADGVGDEHEGEVACGLDVAGAEGTAGGEGGRGALDEEDVPERGGWVS